MDYRDRHVVVTGGTGALGTAVVGALIEAGAVCHVPYIDSAEADRFAWRNHSKVKLVAHIELTQEVDVARLYDGVPQLWLRAMQRWHGRITRPKLGSQVRTNTARLRRSSIATF